MRRSKEHKKSMLNPSMTFISKCILSSLGLRLRSIGSQGKCPWYSRALVLLESEEVPTIIILTSIFVDFFLLRNNFLPKFSKINGDMTTWISTHKDSTFDCAIRPKAKWWTRNFLLWRIIVIPELPHPICAYLQLAFFFISETINNLLQCLVVLAALDTRSNLIYIRVTNLLEPVVKLPSRLSQNAILFR